VECGRGKISAVSVLYKIVFRSSAHQRLDPEKSRAELRIKASSEMTWMSAATIGASMPKNASTT
jgi:hypothetical protein